jgi:hypothetical protein
MIISIRACPKAPRDCLFASTALKARYLRGEIGNIFLRVVDHREPRMQLLQMLGRLLVDVRIETCPFRAVTASSRSCTVCCNCDCALSSNLAQV